MIDQLEALWPLGWEAERDGRIVGTYGYWTFILRNIGYTYQFSVWENNTKIDEGERYLLSDIVYRLQSIVDGKRV